MKLHIHPDNPELRKIRIAVDCLKNGGVIIYPSDTVYSIGCDINQPKAFERLCKIKGIEPKNANFSIICYDLSHLSDYCVGFYTSVYRVLKKAFPGPYTFILKASSNVPKLFQSKKKTIGIRIPNNKIPLEIVKELGNPITSTSVHDDDEILDYTTNPDFIYDKYSKLVDIVIDGGYCGNIPSTVIDCTTGEFNIVRYGLGKPENIL